MIIVEIFSDDNEALEVDGQQVPEQQWTLLPATPMLRTHLGNGMPRVLGM